MILTNVDKHHICNSWHDHYDLSLYISYHIRNKFPSWRRDAVALYKLSVDAFKPVPYRLYAAMEEVIRSFTPRKVVIPHCRNTINAPKVKVLIMQMGRLQNNI